MVIIFPLNRIRSGPATGLVQQRIEKMGIRRKADKPRILGMVIQS